MLEHPDGIEPPPPEYESGALPTVLRVHVLLDEEFEDVHKEPARCKPADEAENLIHLPFPVGLGFPYECKHRAEDCEQKSNDFSGHIKPPLPEHQW